MIEIRVVLCSNDFEEKNIKETLRQYYENKQGHIFYQTKGLKAEYRLVF